MLFSCSSDDSSGDNSNNSGFQLPLTSNKFWTYKVHGQTGETRDSLYISGDTIIDSKTYKRFDVRNGLATGFYSNSLRNNGVREFDNKLLLSGDLSMGLGQNLPIALDLTLSDFIIFKKNATNGEALSLIENSVQQDFGGYPLTINYKLKSIGGESLAAYTSNGVNYTDVKTSKIVLRASITTVQTVMGFTVTIPIMQEQDVLVSTQYIANGIGVVYTKTDMQYQLNASIPITLPIPSSGSTTQEEFLDTHN
ncbi:hypothetical protein LZZ90_08670 [Flavobacterium sp. SM15]|uniref:hypothetical protein n=1 Tax=Flavobacterium sp. SM15 TaxID=2908005 RepID=UPI001EDC0208|nr:hypothetical protein [Flavobacterium sp. SM15]MCG2611578.1 hypothetical protein [Flavobacterium sp. SM15]